MRTRARFSPSVWLSRLSPIAGLWGVLVSSLSRSSKSHQRFPSNADGPTRSKVELVNLLSMRKCAFICSLLFLVGISTGDLAIAQNANLNKAKPETCEGPIYKPREVTKPAKITRLVDPDIPIDLIMTLKGTLRIRAVFCVTGKITDVEVIESMPNGIDELVIKTLLKTKFKPAEKDGQPVSQSFIREVKFGVVAN